MVLVAITKHGAKQLVVTASQMPEASVMASENFGAAVEDLSNQTEVYTGARRAQFAPHIKSKGMDPGVLVVDDASQLVIPVQSGHVDGSNAYAARLSALLGATAVLTAAPSCKRG